MTLWWDKLNIFIVGVFTLCCTSWVVFGAVGVGRRLYCTLWITVNGTLCEVQMESTFSDSEIIYKGNIIFN